jgi:hypothetical protein
MKLQLSLLSAAIVLGASLPALAQTSSSPTSEYSRNKNEPAPKQGTKESRSAERKAQRADMKAQNKAGELPTAGDDWGANGNKPAPKEGTSESRSAERKSKRSEMKQVVKAGEMPVTTEADVSKVKAKAQ